MTSTFYSWINYDTIFSEVLWLDYISAWDDTSFFLTTEYNIFSFFFIPSFISNYFSSTQLSYFSYLDNFVINLHLNNKLLLLNSFYFDTLTWLNLHEKLTLSFVNEGVNYFNLLVYLNPEIILVYLDFITATDLFSLSNITYSYDYFNFNFNFNFLNNVNLFTFFIIWLFFITILFIFTTSTNFFTKNSFFMNKFFFTFVNAAYENRMQLDWVLLFGTFVLIIWIPLLMTYDDTNVEIVEIFHWFIITIFLLAIIQLLFRYSIHYFSFLEASVTDGFSTSFIAKQFVRDVSNSFALFLRFFLLIFRLNIYDGLDDFLDSYFIFFIDFDEDMYIDETLLIQFESFVSPDNAEDVVFYKYYEFDWIGDLFSKYFILLGKFIFFWLFILEEAFRVILAFYISYLIIFEVHAVNASYNEESFQKNSL